MPDSWYDACDEMGVLIYHDAMYAQGGHVPNNATGHQPEELVYQVRRLSHHPSIVLYDACNECGGQGNYASFVMTTIAREDPSRVVWPSCPSNGWIGGVDRLTGLPNGRPLIPKPSAWLSMENTATAAQWQQHELQPRWTTTDANPTDAAVGSSTTQSNCTFIPSLDFAPGTNWKFTGVKGADECCEVCARNPFCFAATLSKLGSNNVCWLKNQSQASKPYYSSGAEGCWVNARGPSPVPSDPRGTCNPLLQQETHGGYQQGDGWKTVNSHGGSEVFSPNVPPMLDPPWRMGLSCPGTYASEFGGSSMSSFESMSPTLAPQDWGLHTPPMRQRNYASDNFIVAYFGRNIVDINATGALALQAQLYLATLGTALEMSSDIQVRRSRNSFGMLTWQLNEIWPVRPEGLRSSCSVASFVSCLAADVVPSAISSPDWWLGWPRVRDRGLHSWPGARGALEAPALLPRTISVHRRFRDVWRGRSLPLQERQPAAVTSWKWHINAPARAFG